MKFRGKYKIMKHYNILKRIVLWSLFPMVWVGCTDWDDHYDADGQQIVSDKTLWEEIAARPELSGFRECLENYGYKAKLNGSQMYTVFAPKGEINIENLTREKVQIEVVENHIARFAHSANSNTIDKSVVMLNAKTVKFTQDGNGYRFGEKWLSNDYNIIAKNGVLHVIEEQQPFFHNIWEYLTTDTRFDKIRNYLYSFNDTILDEDKSVKGEINANGQQEYLDSVVYITNPLLYSLGMLHDEDSTYTMIVPTNEAWDEGYERIKEYYKYSQTISKTKRDSLQKYYTELAMVRDLVFSHTVQKSMEDSLVSTAKGVFKNPYDYILADYVESVECSNGEIFVMNELKHKPWDSWHSTIKIEAEDVSALVTDAAFEEDAFVYRRQVSSADPMYAKISKGGFLEVVDKRLDKKAPYVLTFNLRKTLKGKYDLKFVFLPQEMSSARDKTLLTNKFKVQESHALELGGMSDFKNVSKGALENFVEAYKEEGYKTPDYTLKPDTVLIGSIETACCSYGTETSGLQITLSSSWSKSASTLKKNATTFLIDCIILEPSKE